MTKQQSDAREENGSERPIEVYSLEEMDEYTDEQKKEEDAEDLVDTMHMDGSTANPWLAQEQGLVYDPPTDPPVLASDNSQGVEVAAGYATSMEQTNPDVEDLPARVDNQDLDLQEDVETVLHNNSETANLDCIKVTVRDGVVRLRGTVPLKEDISIVDYLVRDMDGVRSIVNELRQSDSA